MSGWLTLVQREWVSPTGGPIRRIWCTSCGYPDPGWWVYGTEMARAPLGTYWSPVHVAAAGASIDRRQAMVRALGESVERYASMHAIDEAEQVQMPFGATALAEWFPRCSPEEASPPMFRGLNRDVPIGHVRMEQVRDGSAALVPTPYVHLGYLAASEDLLATYPISTGTAFSPDRVQALWRGLCEVAERDAIMLFWLSQSGFRRIEGSSPGASPALVKRLHRLEDVDLAAELLDISTDFPVAVVLAVVRGHEFPYATVGASCQVDVEAACCKALDEAVSVRISLRHEKWHQPVPSLEDFGWVKRLEDHMSVYGSWPESPALEFLKAAPTVSLETAVGEHVTDVPESANAFVAFAGRLYEELGLTVLATELACADTARFGHVVRVVVPEMAPLSQDHQARWLATPRLSRRLAASGHAINPYPHPFA